MIQEGLIATLEKRQILNPRTQFFVEFDKVDVNGHRLHLKDFCAYRGLYKDKNGSYLVMVERVGTGEKFSVYGDNILLVDGMEAETVAKAYDLNPDGTKKALGKRRGRPRKHFPYGKDA